MPVRKGTQSGKVLHRRAQVAELYLKGLKQYQIAQALGIDDGAGTKMVSIDLKELKKEWKKNATRDFDEAKALQFAKLENLERELWKAWERSQSEGVVTTSEVEQRPGRTKKGQLVPPETQQLISTTVRKAKRDGDSAYTAQILQCLRDQAELLGIIAAPGEESTSPPIVSFKINRVERSSPQSSQPSDNGSTPGEDNPIPQSQEQTKVG